LRWHHSYDHQPKDSTSQRPSKDRNTRAGVLSSCDSESTPLLLPTLSAAPPSSSPGPGIVHLYLSPSKLRMSSSRPSAGCAIASSSTSRVNGLCLSLSYKNSVREWRSIKMVSPGTDGGRSRLTVPSRTLARAFRACSGIASFVLLPV